MWCSTFSPGSQLKKRLRGHTGPDVRKVSKLRVFSLRYDQSHVFVLNIERLSLFHLPFFHFSCRLYLLDVHAEFVFDIRRGSAGVRLEVFKDNPSPVCIILQELKRFAHQLAFSGDCLKLIQVQTLSTNTEALPKSLTSV